MITMRMRLPAVALVAAALLTVPVGALAATSEPAGLNAQMSNALPSLGSVVLYTSAPSVSTQACPAGGVTSFDPTPGTVTTVYVCAPVTDANGHADVCANAVEKTLSVFNSGNTLLNDNDGNADKSAVALACTQESGTAAVLTGSFDMEFWRAAGAAASTTAYYTRLTVTDFASATDTADGTFDWTAAKAINVAASGSTFGELAAGDTSSEVTMTVENVGNVAFTDVTVEALSLTGTTNAQEIALSNLKFSLTSGQAAASGAGLSTTPQNTGVTLSVASTDTPTSDLVYVALTMPDGASGWVPADTYATTVTLTAV